MDVTPKWMVPKSKMGTDQKYGKPYFRLPQNGWFIVEPENGSYRGTPTLGYPTWSLSSLLKPTAGHFKPKTLWMGQNTAFEQHSKPYHIIYIWIGFDGSLNCFPKHPMSILT